MSSSEPPTPASSPIPVLEVGGSHVTAALLPAKSSEPPLVIRRLLDPDGSADAIADRIAEAAAGLQVGQGADWAVAMPGPFDYERGIGLFAHVGKFESLYGVDVRALLLDRLPARPASIHFLNDADAYGLGEAVSGAGRGHRRVVCLTLGTGIGSAFLCDAVPVTSGDSVPRDGRAHWLSSGSRPLEETVSTRAIRAAYATPGDAPDVKEIAQRARTGDLRAAAVIDAALDALGVTMAPWVRSFGATVVVIGGSMAASWDLVRPPLARTLEHSGVRVVPAEHLDLAPVYGAAHWLRVREFPRFGDQ